MELLNKNKEETRSGKLKIALCSMKCNKLNKRNLTDCLMADI